MIIEVLDRDTRQFKGSIGRFESFIWTERYWDFGDFELVLPLNTFSASYMVQDDYLKIDSSDTLMIVESIEFASPLVDDGGHITVKGHSLDIIINRRILTKKYKASLEPQAYILQLMNKCFGSAAEEIRRVSYLKYEDNTDEDVETESVKIDEGKGTNLGDIILAGVQKEELGFRINFNPVTLDFLFEIFNGADKTYISFNETNLMLQEAKLFRSVENFKTAALVQGSDGESIVELTDEKLITGLNRREVFVSATDISKETSGYRKELELRGKNELEEYKKVETIDGMLMNLGTYKLRRDFDLGDLITIQNSYFRATARITEVIQSWDQQGYQIYPGFIVKDIDVIDVKSVYKPYIPDEPEPPIPEPPIPEGTTYYTPNIHIQASLKINMEKHSKTLTFLDGGVGAKFGWNINSPIVNSLFKISVLVPDEYSDVDNVEFYLREYPKYKIVTKSGIKQYSTGWITNEDTGTILNKNANVFLAVNFNNIEKSLDSIDNVYYIVYLDIYFNKTSLTNQTYSIYRDYFSVSVSEGGVYYGIGDSEYEYLNEDINNRLKFFIGASIQVIPKKDKEYIRSLSSSLSSFSDPSGTNYSAESSSIFTISDLDGNDIYNYFTKQDFNSLISDEPSSQNYTYRINGIVIRNDRRGGNTDVAIGGTVGYRIIHEGLKIKPINCGVYFYRKNGLNNWIDNSGCQVIPFTDDCYLFIIMNNEEQNYLLLLDFTSSQSYHDIKPVNFDTGLEIEYSQHDIVNGIYSRVMTFKGKNVALKVFRSRNNYEPFTSRSIKIFINPEYFIEGEDIKIKTKCGMGYKGLGVLLKETGYVYNPFINVYKSSLFGLKKLKILLNNITLDPGFSLKIKRIKNRELLYDDQLVSGKEVVFEETELDTINNIYIIDTNPSSTSIANLDLIVLYLSLLPISDADNQWSCISGANKYKTISTMDLDFVVEKEV